MSLSDTAENNLMLLLFNNTAWANFGDAAGLRATTGAGSLYLTLHTADPGDTYNSANEVVSGVGGGWYGYTRQPVARTTGGWTVVGNAGTNAAAISFPLNTSGSVTVTHWSLHYTYGAVAPLVIGSLDASRTISSGVTAQFAAGALTISCD